METLRDKQLAWIRHIEKVSGKTPTEIARLAGFNPSTFSKFFNNKQGHTLTAKIVQRIEDATRVPAYEHHVKPKLVAFREGEAERYSFGATPASLLEASLKDAVAKSNGVDLWVSKTSALEAVGYHPGMVVVVDRDAKARNGDAVVAQIYDTRTGTAETVFRVYRTPYLLSAFSQSEPALPIVVDDDRVAIMGVITGGVFIRH